MCNEGAGCGFFQKIRCFSVIFESQVKDKKSSDRLFGVLKMLCGFCRRLILFVILRSSAVGSFIFYPHLLVGIAFSAISFMEFEIY